MGNTLNKKGKLQDPRSKPVVSRVAKRSNKESKREGNTRSRNNQEYRTTHAAGS